MTNERTPKAQLIGQHVDPFPADFGPQGSETRRNDTNRVQIDVAKCARDAPSDSRMLSFSTRTPALQLSMILQGLDKLIDIFGLSCCLSPEMDIIWVDNVDMKTAKRPDALRTATPRAYIARHVRNCFACLPLATSHGGSTIHCLPGILGMCTTYET